MDEANYSTHISSDDRIHVPCDLCGADNPELLFVKDTFRHVRCSRCGMVYVTPRLRDASEQQEIFYDHDACLSCSSGFEEMASKDYRGSRKKKLLAEADSYRLYYKTGYILDIGCGFGSFLRAASERGWPHPEGIEIAPQAALYVRRFFPVKTSELEENMYEKNLFDVVRLNNVIEHLPSPRKLVEIVHHILRPGGLLIISTTNFDSFSVTIWGSAWQYIGGADHICLFTPKTLKILLEENDFRVIRLKTRGVHLTPKSHDHRSNTAIQRLSGKGIKIIEKALDRFVRHTSKGHRLKIWAEKI
jgi:2-polyprenyl-3-methyl-5-hydroxy-6-metoxy-1,4-benzoquinol methylase